MLTPFTTFEIPNKTFLIDCWYNRTKMLILFATFGIHSVPLILVVQGTNIEKIVQSI